MIVRLVRDVPDPSAFSMPPTRCSRPGVPGTAQGRASVAGSRTYGQNEPVPSGSTWFGLVANSTAIAGRLATSGTCHGSEPFARYPSESRNTGVRYLRAIRAASIAASKQCAGCAAPLSGRVHSPCLPYMACRRSDCSLFVGSPVEGPPRRTSTTTRGSSRADGHPYRLGLEVDTGTARAGHTERPPEGGTDGGTDGGNLVLRLERPDPELLALRQLVEDVRRGRDRVGAQEQRQLRLSGGGDETPGKSRVAGDVRIGAGWVGRGDAPDSSTRTARRSRRSSMPGPKGARALMSRTARRRSEPLRRSHSIVVSTQAGCTTN